MPSTVIEMFNDTVAAQGDAPAMHHKVGEDWQTTSWTQYGADVRALALALDARGLGKGSSVGVLSAGLPAYFVTDMAAAAIGGRTASIYPTNAPDGVLHVLKNSDSSICFCQDRSQVDKVREVADQVPGIVVVSYEDDSGDVTYDALLAEGRALLDTKAGRYEEMCAAVDPSDAVCIIYTSGTTGPPKGALIPHSSVVTVLNAVAKDFPVPEFRVVSYLPLAHIAERDMSLYCHLIDGGQVWFSTIHDLPGALPVAKPTRFMAVPRVWEKFQEGLESRIPGLLDMPEENKKGLVTMMGFGELLMPVSGAAPIGKSTLDFFMGLGIEILEVYGMTETTGFTTANRPGKAKLGSVGQAVAGVEVKLGEDGELMCKGANFTAYEKNPEETADTLVDGWVRTGDIATIDDDGFVTIVGRKKDLIITAGGENISPSNIQMGLTASPYISQAVVIGDRRRFVSALVTLSEDGIRSWAKENGLGDASMADLAKDPKVHDLIAGEVAKANESLARVSQVREFRILPRDFTVEDGELTPTMKLKRNVVEKEYSDLIEAIYA